MSVTLLELLVKDKIMKKELTKALKSKELRNRILESIDTMIEGEYQCPECGLQEEHILNVLSINSVTIDIVVRI